MRRNLRIDWLRVGAAIGAFHYAVAVLLWSLGVFVLLRQGGRPDGWTHVAVRMIPCLLFFWGFVVAVVFARRRRKLARWLVSILVVLSLMWFGFDACRQDYQIGAMTDHGCDHYYATWWWYNDRWDPRR